MRYDPPFHHTAGLKWAWIGMIVMILFPLLTQNLYLKNLLIVGFLYSTLAISWDFSLGDAGIFNFAHCAFFTVGLYAYALASVWGPLDPWVCVIFAGVVATGLGVLIAIPVLRLDGIYVVLTTVAVAALLRQVTVSQSQWTGGTSGMAMLPSLTLGGRDLGMDGNLGYYYVTLVLLIVTIVAFYKLKRGRLGRLVRSLRDQKFLSIARGISEGRTRMLTLGVSALFPGLAGALYGAFSQVASPEFYGLSFLTTILAIVLIGGLGTLWGSLLSAILVIGVRNALVTYGAWSDIALGGLILVVLIFYPGGLWALIQEIRDVSDAWKTDGVCRLRRYLQRRVRRRLMSGAEEEYVETDHGTIAVCDGGGSGAPLLLIHGNSACKEAFRKQYADQELRRRLRLISLDLPGHGVSSNGIPEKDYNLNAYCEVVEEIVKVKKLTKILVFGWSLGGYVALELMARGKIELAGVMISGTPPHRKMPEDASKGYVQSEAMLLTAKRFFTRRDRRLYGNSALVPRNRESAFLHKTLARTDGRARSFMMDRLSTTDWPRQMNAIMNGQVKFVIADGADDPFLNREYMNNLTLKDGWSHQLVNIVGAAHAPFYAKPEEFNALILDSFSEFIDEYRKCAATLKVKLC